MAAEQGELLTAYPLHEFLAPQRTTRLEVTLPSLDDLAHVAAKAIRVTISLGISTGLITATSLGQPRPTLAEGIREFDILGTLDCGVKSGRRCRIPNWETKPIIGIVTTDYGANKQRVGVDISDVKRFLDNFDQDDLVWVTVQDQPGTLRATRILRYIGDGTDNQGLSTGSRKMPEKGREPKKNH